MAAPTPAKAPAKATAPADAPFGVDSQNRPVMSSFQPSVASLAIALTPHLQASEGLNEILPLPSGLHLMRPPDKKESQIQLRVAPFFARKLRRIFVWGKVFFGENTFAPFGCVAEITLTDGEGADTPAQLQIVTRIPWRYGTNVRETGLSWILVRVQAFVSKALFDSPARVVLCAPPLFFSFSVSFSRAHPRIKLGHCVSGFCEPTNGDTKSCNIVGWDTCSLDMWRACSPTTAISAFDLNMDAVFRIPQLSGVNFGYKRLPHVSHGVFSAGPIGGSFALPSELSDELVVQLRSQHLAQNLLHGHAPSAVAHIPPPPAARGRSNARGTSRVRAPPTAASASAPATAPVGILICSVFHLSSRYFWVGQLPCSPGWCRCLGFFGPAAFCPYG